MNFFDNRQSLVFSDQRKLKVKWQKDFFNDKTLFNDVFDKETIHRTLYISGFDKEVYIECFILVYDRNGCFGLDSAHAKQQSNL